jgi:HIRAN domain
LVRVIHIAWREKAGKRRYIVAKIKRNAHGVFFKPFAETMEKAKEAGLDYLAGFHDLSKVTNQDVSQLLSHRVISKDRPDRKSFLDFWEASNTDDIFDILALTQGKSPTDNFEFLAEFYPRKGTKFVTDLAGLSHLNIERDSLKIGETLTFKKEKTNPVDKYAIAICKGDLKIGYVKQIHNKFFHCLKHPVKLSIKAIDQNGRIRQVFMLVEVG